MKRINTYVHIWPNQIYNNDSNNQIYEYAQHMYAYIHNPELDAFKKN